MESLIIIKGPLEIFTSKHPCTYGSVCMCIKNGIAQQASQLRVHFLRSDLLYFFFFFFFFFSETGWMSNQTQALVSNSLQSSKFHSRTSDFGAVFENQNPLSSTWRSQFFSGKAQVLRAKSFFKMLVNSQHYCALGTACAVHDNPDFLEFSKNILKFYPDYIVHRHSYTWLVKTVESFPGYPYLNVLTYLEMS